MTSNCPLVTLHTCPFTTWVAQPRQLSIKRGSAQQQAPSCGLSSQMQAVNSPSRLRGRKKVLYLLDNAARRDYINCNGGSVHLLIQNTYSLFYSPIQFVKPNQTCNLCFFPRWNQPSCLQASVLWLPWQAFSSIGKTTSPTALTARGLLRVFGKTVRGF